jgi:peptidoglycan-N-acetylglucosamine deacetylase
VDRRVFLTALAAGTLSALAGCAGEKPPTEAFAKVSESEALALRLPPQTAGHAVQPPPTYKATPGQPQTLDRLTGGAGRMALTVDDGTSPEVLAAYVDFVIASGIRLTFFVNGVYPSWLQVKAKLVPLVETGQVQLGNHTWDHPSITELSDSEVARQLQQNETFLRKHFGVAGAPYFRPPYGNHNERTDRISSGLGFSRTVMWWGSLGDSAVLTAEQVLAQARKWFLAERLIIGHANHPAVTHIYPEMLQLIRSRNLQTVTLRDVFGDLPLTAALAAS